MADGDKSLIFDSEDEAGQANGQKKGDTENK